jgi:hypothetical protein
MTENFHEDYFRLGYNVKCFDRCLQMFRKNILTPSDLNIEIVKFLQKVDKGWVGSKNWSGRCAMEKNLVPNGTRSDRPVHSQSLLRLSFTL